MPCKHDLLEYYMLGHIYDLKCASSQNSEIGRILLKFYPDKVLTANDVGTRNNDHNHNSKIICQLTKNNYLEKIDSPYHATKYKITLRGKCRILCNKFRISFLCLCILTEAYALYNYQKENRCDSTYVLVDLKDSLCDLYTIRNIKNSANFLCVKKFVHRIDSKRIGINKLAIKKLNKHKVIITELHDWIVGVAYQMGQLSMHAPDTLSEIQSSIK